MHACMLDSLLTSPHPAPASLQVVVFTASLGKYADPLLDLLDKANVVRWRLFREACYPYEGTYVKVGRRLGRWRGGRCRHLPVQLLMHSAACAVPHPHALPLHCPPATNAPTLCSRPHFLACLHACCAPCARRTFSAWVATCPR
jgi:hypothetical protein